MEANSELVPDPCHSRVNAGSLPLWEVKSPHSCSFTDQFLEFLRQRSQAITAAEQIGQEDQDEFWGDDPDIDPPTQVRADLTVLQDRGGERHWRFYRPDPFAIWRPLALDLRVLADHTLEYVEGRILHHWPGLANPLVQWKVVSVHHSVNLAIHIPEDVEVFLLEVNIDLQFGRVPIMVEKQHWDVSRGYFHGYIEPRARYEVTRGISLMHHDLIGHECNTRPCFASLNGGERRP